jgi:hypothetical protein
MDKNENIFDKTVEALIQDATELTNRYHALFNI